MFQFPAPKSQADYKEFDYVDIGSAASRIGVEVEKVKEPADVERVGRKIRDKSILFVNVKPLKLGNAIDFSTCMNSLKRRCESAGSSIFFADDGWLLIAPAGIELQKNI